jgi:hypothetical protein
MAEEYIMANRAKKCIYRTILTNQYNKLTNNLNKTSISSFLNDKYQAEKSEKDSKNVPGGYLTTSPKFGPLLNKSKAGGAKGMSAADEEFKNYINDKPVLTIKTGSHLNWKWIDHISMLYFVLFVINIFYKSTIHYSIMAAFIVFGGLFISSLGRGSILNPVYSIIKGMLPGGGGSGGGLGSMFGGGGSGGGKTAWGGKPGKIPKGFKFPKGAGGAMKGLGTVGKLAKGAGILSVAGAGIDLAGNLMDDERSTGNAVAKTLDQNKFTALGAGIGALFGGVGALPGAAIGGIADMLLADKTQIVEDAYAPASKGPFTILDKFGKMAKTTDGDDLYAGPNIDVNKITNVAGKPAKTENYSTPNNSNNNMDFTKVIEAINNFANKPINITLNIDGRQVTGVVVNQLNKNMTVVS